MISPQDTNWYVLYTAPRAEKQVKERIDLLGVECWLPLHRTPRVWSDRVKIVEIPLFSSYVFVRCTDAVLRDLLKVYGVIRIVFITENRLLSARSKWMLSKSSWSRLPNMSFVRVRR